MFCKIYADHMGYNERLKKIASYQHIFQHDLNGLVQEKR